MNDFLRQIQNMISRRQMLATGEPVLVAVSGGADSVCLLLVLKELGYAVHAVHVEHGIRGEESLEDCSFVQDQCAREKIPLTVRRIDAPALSASSGRSVEEAARDARYRILMETAQNLKISAVATAHHMDDRAETVLWNMMRGSSLAGLSGILPVREAEGAKGPRIRIIRPLLETGRDEIERWLTERGQSWREDRTNLDTEITRNAIRLQILPQMEKLNSETRRHIAQTADDLAQVENYLEEVTQRAYDRTVRYAAAHMSTDGALNPTGQYPAQSSGTIQDIDSREADNSDVSCRETDHRNELLICLKELEAQPELIRRRIFHRVLGQAEGGLRDITREHVESLMRLAGMDNGRRISLPYGLQAVREEGVIRLTRSTSSCITEEIRIDSDGEYLFPGGYVVKAEFGIWEGGDVSKKKYTKTLAYDTMIPYITLRTRREGDWIQVNSQGGRRKLKDYLIDEKIPRDRRDQIPLIAQGSHVLWVIGLRISEAAKVSEGAHFAKITVIPGQQVTGRDPAHRRDL